MHNLNWLELAAKVRVENRETMVSWWCDQTLAVWLRDGGRCVFCDENLMARRELAYYYSSIDHLLPKAEDKYPQFQNMFWNQVLCCRSCNGIKRDTDPSKGALAESVLTNPEYQPDNALVEQWIKTVWEAIELRRSQLNERFDRESSLINDALSNLTR